MDADTLWHPQEKINKWPPLYFWFVFGVLVQKACTCCVSVLYGRSELLGHWTAVCPLHDSFLFLVESGCCCSLHVFTQSVWQLRILLVSSFRIAGFLQYFLLPTSTWETFIYIVLFFRVLKCHATIFPICPPICFSSQLWKLLTFLETTQKAKIGSNLRYRDPSEVFKLLSKEHWAPNWFSGAS